ncbi:MAG: HAD family hydrolase [Corynebacterium sp.]|uniref:HAD family hydrolase n=1 Tax=Corynebacterium sp. TaxID=1720 RepID=UPI0026DF373C|nr:HAD family hydrolase [Corynebacterium sp.]MDO5669890.1 HAD family hydrolase [Corynebacterium sp.]
MKIAAFDIDGTLLFPAGIADADIAAIRDWQRSGHLAVAATGKSLHGLHRDLAPYDLSFDYSVVSTGAGVSDRAGNYLFSRTVPTDSLRDILTPLLTDPTLAVYATTLHGPDRLLSEQPARLSGTILRQWERLAISELGDHEVSCVPVWVPDNPARQQQLREKILATCPGVAVHTNRNFLDIVPAGVDKATGLREITAHLGVQAEMISFGDSFNDLAMHAFADHAVAFPWSPPEVVDAADEVAHAVAPVLRRLI